MPLTSSFSFLNCFRASSFTSLIFEYQCPICAFHVILWLMGVGMLYRVTFANVGSIVCVVQNKQLHFFLQWLSYFKQMKRFLSNITCGNIFRGNDVEWVCQLFE